jgi:hypothetical protein
VGGGVGADTEAINNLFDFKKYVIKSCCKYNITPSAAVFVYIRI